MCKLSAEHMLRMEIVGSERMYIFYSNICCLISPHEDWILPSAKYESVCGMFLSFWIFDSLRVENNTSVQFSSVSLIVKKLNFFPFIEESSIFICENSLYIPWPFSALGYSFFVIRSFIYVLGEWVLCLW